MKIKFELTDEKTIINQTVKISAQISGVINDQDRGQLEQRAQEVAEKLIPGASWAFSNFQFLPDGFTFRISATTRIDSSQNDQLEQKAKAVSNSKLTVALHNPDVSIPLFQRRAAESEIRIALIDKAKAEAEKLGGKLTRIEFTESNAHAITSNSYRAASTSFEDAAGGAKGLGHSEKIQMSANLTITVDEDKRVPLNG